MEPKEQSMHEKNTRRGSGIPLGKYAPAAIIALALMGVCLVAMIPADKPALPTVEQPAVNVNVKNIQTTDVMADTFVLTAVVEPERVVKVSAEVSGRIERYGCIQNGSSETIPLEEGTYVSKGDAILFLNRELLQARFDRAQAQLEFDQTEYKRIAALYKEGTASKTEFDDKRTKKDISIATRNEAAEELERTTVIAPISGILNTLPMEVGEYASPGMQVAEIVDMTKAKVVVNVPEKDVHHLKTGDKTEVLVHSPQETTLIGEITYISELSDESTRTTRVEITVDNDNRQLRSGQIVRAKLTRRLLNNVIMVPLSAVIPLENGKAVYVVDKEQKAERKLVELGFFKGRSVRILSGLNEGDRLIIAGHRYVGPGQPVTVIEEN